MLLHYFGNNVTNEMKANEQDKKNIKKSPKKQNVQATHIQSFVN